MNTKKIGAMFVLALFMVSIVPFALANYDSLTQQYKTTKDKYVIAKQKYKAATSRWSTFHDQFVHAEEVGYSDELVNEAQDYLTAVAELEVAMLDFGQNIVDIYNINEPGLSNKIEDTKAEISEDIIPSIENLETKSEFIDVAKDLNSLRLTSSHLLKNSMGLVAWYKLTHTIDKMETIYKKLYDKVENSNLVNKNELMDKLNEAMNDIEFAKSQAQLAREKYSDASNNENMDAFLVQADNSLHKANNYLKDSVKGVRYVIANAKKTNPSTSTPETN